MKKFIIGIGILSLLFFFGITYIKTIKFDTTVFITVTQGRLQGLRFQLLHHKISYNDMQVKNKFWESPLGKDVFTELSAAVQALIIISKKYVHVEFEVNYFGIMIRHYQLLEDDGLGYRIVVV